MEKSEGTEASIVRAYISSCSSSVLLDEHRGGIGLREIGGNDMRSDVVCGFQFFCECLQSLLISCDEHKIVTVRCEKLCEFHAEATRGAGNEGGFHFFWWVGRDLNPRPMP